MTRNTTPPSWASWGAALGLITIMCSTLMPLLHLWLPAVKWVFGAGALLHLAARIAAAPSTRGLPVRLRRLYRIELWAGLFFVAATVFMFLRSAGPTDWIAFTLAGGALLVYTSIMIPRIAAKEGKNS